METAQLGWPQSGPPTADPNGFDVGTITKDPQGRLWSISGKINGETGRYWQQLTGKGGIWDNNAFGLPPGVEVNTPWYVADQPRIALQSKSNIKIGPLGGETPTEDRTLRWPLNAINTDTDYVFFQFGRYLPPFSQDSVYKLRQKEENNFQKVKGKTKEFKAATYQLYNSSVNNLDVSDSANNIMLPIPQDLSNEIQQVWQGKQFTQLGRAAVAAMGGGNFAYASDVVQNITGNFKAIKDALATTALNSIPGVGGNIELSDVSGSTRGVVINPNAELLYDSPEMREIGMIFKLVPRNQKEAKQIQNIVMTFRAASMPRWGGTGGEPLRTPVGGGTSGEDDIINFGGENNWIRVPDLCKFTFMKGTDPHPYLIQFKPCAINRVEVNYTSDGTYATYSDGQPVCTELRLNFMETKLVFADEVGMGY